MMRKRRAEDSFKIMNDMLLYVVIVTSQKCLINKCLLAKMLAIGLSKTTEYY